MSEQSFEQMDVLQFMEEIAPAELAESWDHVGLMIGGGKASLTHVVLSLDADREALELCIEVGAGLLITHHPLFFPSVTSINYSTPCGALIRDFIRKDICVYSAHTNLDRVHGGVNYALAEIVGLTVPMSITGVDFGLCGDLQEGSSLVSIAKRTRKLLEGGGVQCNMDADMQINRIFVMGGSFDAAYIPSLAKAHVDLVISGEIKYHHMMDLRAIGIAALAVGHDVSERVVLPSLEKRLNLQFPGLGVAIAGGLDYNKLFTE
jgi:dinuclear metal center YbgI/SA1388 family protein